MKSGGAVQVAARWLTGLSPDALSQGRKHTYSETSQRKIKALQYVTLLSARSWRFRKLIKKKMKNYGAVSCQRAEEYMTCLQSISRCSSLTLKRTWSSFILQNEAAAKQPTAAASRNIQKSFWFIQNLWCLLKKHHQQREDSRDVYCGSEACQAFYNLDHNSASVVVKK